MNDKYLIPVFVSGTILLVLFVFFIIAYLLVQKHKQNAYALEKSRIAYDHRNNILKTRIDEQERTLHQISKELHDNIGMLLHFKSLNIDRIGMLATDEEQKKLIRNAQDILDHLLADVRSISHSLNSDYVKNLGIKDAVTKELEYVHAATGIVCTVNVEGNEVGYAPAKELLVYRIVQEALHNVMKHAKATKLDVVLSYELHSFEISMTDNGVGFDTIKVYEFNGIGFVNMLQRAKMLNGHLGVRSEPGKGSTITLQMDDKDAMNERYLEEEYLEDNATAMAECGPDNDCKLV